MSFLEDVWGGVKGVGSAATGVMTGGMLGDERFGFMDNVLGGTAGELAGDLGTWVTGGDKRREADKAMRKGLSEAGGIVTEGYGNASQMYDPYTGLAGVLPGMQQDVNSGMYMGPQQGFNFSYEDDPGQEFARNQGLAAVQANMRSQGLNESGAEQKAIANYITGLAGQQYGQNRQQAFGEFQDARNFGANQLQNQYARQLGLAGIGMNAIGQQAGMQTGLAGTMADLAMGSAQSRANRLMGDAAARSNLIGQGMGLAGTIGGAFIGGPAGAAIGGKAGGMAGGMMSGGQQSPYAMYGGYA